MNIQERSTGRVTILDLEGKLASGDGDLLLRDKVRSLLFQKKNQIVINMADVSFVDSSGLGALCSAATTARHVGGDITLLNLTKRVRDLLTISKLVTVFDTYESEAAAAEGFAVLPVG